MHFLETQNSLKYLHKSLIRSVADYKETRGF